MSDKDRLYWEAGLRNSQAMGRVSLGVGFFSSFTSVRDFRRELQAPLMVPFICFAEVLKETLDSLKEVCLTAVCLATLDLSRAFGHLGSAIGHFFEAGCFVINAVIDTIASLLSFVSRSLATLFVIAQVVMGDDVDEYQVEPQAAFLRHAENQETRFIPGQSFNSLPSSSSVGYPPLPEDAPVASAPPYFSPAMDPSLVPLQLTEEEIALINQTSAPVYPSSYY